MVSFTSSPPRSPHINPFNLSSPFLTALEAAEDSHSTISSSDDSQPDLPHPENWTANFSAPDPSIEDYQEYRTHPMPASSPEPASEGDLNELQKGVPIQDC